ncbi:12827_t:CDS:2, partial [Funneliformis caledonium]
MPDVDLNSNNERNILLIGRTGNGKSTLGNVLVNKNGDFETVFKESSYGVSETRDIDTGEFMIDSIKYKVIDTVGLGDTKLNRKEVMYKLGEAAHKTRDGLNQLLFVTSSRFTEEERFTYNLLREIIFDDDIVNHTTIVRTNFENFMDEDEIKEDQRRMISENAELARVICSCNKIIHVNNPPMNIKDARRLKLNKEDREDSRSKLLLHLGACKDTIYRPKNLDKMQREIVDLKAKVSKETRGFCQIVGEAMDVGIEKLREEFENKCNL